MGGNGRAKPVIRSDNAGNETRFKSSFKAAESVGGSQSNIARACKLGVPAYGYRWRYEEDGE